MAAHNTDRMKHEHPGPAGAARLWPRSLCCHDLPRRRRNNSLVVTSCRRCVCPCPRLL